MVFDISKINGINEYETKIDVEAKPGQPDKKRTMYYHGEKAFLIDNGKTLEFRTDEKLAENLKDKYESVMESRYFGRGGIEVVPAGQLTSDEIEDLIRLSYNLTQ